MEISASWCRISTCAASLLSRTDCTMVAPGLALLARSAGHLSAYCLISTASWRLLSLCGISISFWWLVAGLIACLPLGITFKILARNYEAATFGARPMHVLQGEIFGNIDLMFKLVEAMRTGYPGASHRSYPFPNKTQTSWTGDGMTDMVAAVGNCYNFRVLFDDLLFTCEPHHIKVGRPTSILLDCLMLVQAILATDFENFVKGRR